MTLYLLKYNNYYNRIVKRLSTIDEYLEYQVGEPVVNKNFIPNDYVSASVVVNNWLDEFPDYAIVVDDTDIVSRWFVIDSSKTSTHQYKFSLFRDTLADYLDEVMTAPIFIEKAPLADSDSFIFNSEDMTFNQIKTKEQYLVDRYDTAWLIGYMGTDNPTGDAGYKFNFERTVQPDYTVQTLSEYTSVSGVSAGETKYITDYAYQVHGRLNARNNFTMSFNNTGKKPIDYPNGTTIGYSKTNISSYPQIKINDYKASNNPVPNILNAYIAALDSNDIKLVEAALGYKGVDAYNRAVQERNKIIYVADEGVYYQIDVVEDYIYGTDRVAPGTDISRRLTDITNEISQTYPELTFIGLEDGQYPNGQTFSRCNTARRATVTFRPYEGVAVESTEVEISKGRTQLTDAPYCMFAIPFNEDRMCIKDGNIVFPSAGRQLALDFVNSMSKALTGVGQLIDIQLLPYCPFPERIVDYGSDRVIDISNLVENADYQFIKTDDEWGEGIMMYWCSKSTFSNTINTQIVNPFIGKNFSNKLWNETVKYRLCSPNFSSSFEFSAAKNNGVLNFNVDCTYKPFQPYIHVNPAFNGLYGEDFDDPRGLICGGEFSLAQLNDAWQTYQWQNINYEKTFQRQIENMDIQHKYQALEDKLGAAMGTIMGGLVGANTGGMLSAGNPIGLAAGAGVGAIGSLVSGIADININAKLRDEAKDYTIDMYNYNLGNIQALPTTISKVSAFTANNKIYPVLETYNCTEQELNAFINKLKYNSCTVMRIGTLEEFIIYKNEDYNYFRGQLIRLDIADDFHIVNTIAGELKKGVFI